MESKTTIYEQYYDELFERALEVYKMTTEKRELEKMCQIAEEKLKEILPEKDYNLVIKETDVFVISAEAEGKFLYKQGFCDCIGILKHFGVI